jgi:hypothetical protein
MRFARLVLPFLAASALAACSDSPTAPAVPEAPPSRDESTECAVKVSVTQEDGSIVWVCSPNMGSGG